MDIFNENNRKKNHLQRKQENKLKTKKKLQ